MKYISFVKVFSQLFFKIKIVLLKLSFPFSHHHFDSKILNINMIFFLLILPKKTLNK